MKRRVITVNLIQTISHGTRLRQENLFLASLHCDHLEQELSNKIRRAYRLAKMGHADQLRDNGEPYLSHLCNTTGILVNELGIKEVDLICASLLHDVWEDAGERVSLGLIELLFGQLVADFVETLSKPKRSDPRFFDDRERHEFYFTQLKKADNRVKLLKLCDRLHEVRTLWNCDPSKRGRKMRETKTVYLPLVNDIREYYPWEARYLRKQILFGLRSLSFCEGRPR